MPVLPEAKPLDTSTTSTYVLCPSTTTFVKACREGDAEAAATFLRDGASVDRPEAGMTALMHAANEGHHAVCELLLKAGAQIDAQDPEDGTSAPSSPPSRVTNSSHCCCSRRAPRSTTRIRRVRRRSCMRAETATSR